MIRLTLAIIIFIVLGGIGFSKVRGFNYPLTNKLEPKVKALEDAIVSLRGDVAGMRSSAGSSPAPQPRTDYDGRIKALEQAVADLKNQTAVSVSSVPQKSPLYIPLGSGGSAGDRDWHNMPGYEVSIDVADYPGYSGMQTEVNFRMTEVAGVGMARLYNQTDKEAVGGEVNIASEKFGLKNSSSFKLPAGRKTYSLQIKSTYGANLEIQSARIKVSF